MDGWMGWLSLVVSSLRAPSLLIKFFVNAKISYGADRVKRLSNEQKVAKVKHFCIVIEHPNFMHPFEYMVNQSQTTHFHKEWELYLLPTPRYIEGA